MEKIGIIIGRFQVPELHEGHKYLIRKVLKEFDRVIMFIGCTKTGKPSSHDPLPFDARYIMIKSEFPRLEEIYLLEDVGDWQLWVEKLDQTIYEITGRNEDIYICGSRDSVPEKYKTYGGKYETYLIPSLGEFSGTAARKELENYKPSWTPEERKLIVWYLQQNSDIQG